jgi:hypothetical protein
LFTGTPNKGEGKGKRGEKKEEKEGERGRRIDVCIVQNM